MYKTIKDILSESLIEIKESSDNSLSLSRLDIEYCLMEALKKSKEYLYSYPEKIIDDSQMVKFESLFSSRLSGKPMAYILGYHDFYKYRFEINQNVLIPRNETEIIVPKILEVGDQIFHKIGELRVIDAGSGSGCIGISIAKERKNWDVLLIEKSEKAIKLLKKNKSHHLVNNVKIIHSDWLTSIQANSIDMVISNPPYIAKNSKFINKYVDKYEPELSLYSKENGFFDLRKLIVASRKALKNDGVLILENGYDQSDKVMRCLKENYYKDIDIILDYNEIKRFTLSRNSNYEQKDNSQNCRSS